MIFPPDHTVFVLFNAKMAIVTHGIPFNERCRKRHCRPMGHYLVFCCCTSNENSSLKTSKIRWICLISSKNRCLKHRFFTLFRRALKRARDCLSMKPDSLTMSERFAGKVRQVWAICRFFSSCLSKFTQTWWAFQARNRERNAEPHKKAADTSCTSGFRLYSFACAEKHLARNPAV